MKPIRIQSNQPDNFLRVSYTPIDLCNFRCRYCTPDLYAGNSPRPDNLELIIDNFNHLFDYYIANGKTKFELQILGGEPTIWSKLETFINGIKQKHDIIVSIQSNGSRTIRWWEENAKLFDRVYLTAHHKEIDIDHLMSVADLLYDNNVLVDTIVCMDPYAWDKCKSLVEHLKTSKRTWYIGTQKIEEANKVNVYTDEQLKYLSNSLKRIPNLWYAFKMKNRTFSHSSKIYFDNNKSKRVQHNDVAINQWNYFYNWKCNIGIDSIHITTLGKLQGSCGEKLYNLSEFYNIYDADFIEKFNPGFVPTTCRQLGCYCVPETLLTKSKT
jgi:MoaA/NifB/PqqE/SkfB family radical SAM enzyme